MSEITIDDLLSSVQVDPNQIDPKTENKVKPVVNKLSKKIIKENNQPIQQQPSFQQPSFQQPSDKKVVEEQRIKKQSLLVMLNRYHLSPKFGDYLRSFEYNLSPASLKNKSIDELENLLKDIRICISHKQMSSFWSDTIFGGVGFAENICVNSKLNDKIKLSGLTEALKKNEQFAELLEQIELENQSLSYMRPEHRLVYCVLQSAISVHTLNCVMEKRREMLNATPLDAKLETENPPKGEDPREKYKSLHISPPISENSYSEISTHSGPNSGNSSGNSSGIESSASLDAPLDEPPKKNDFVNSQ